MSSRLETRWVPLYGTPSWHLEPSPQTWWRLGDDEPRSALALVDAPADLPAPSQFVPTGHPPAFPSIEGAGVIRGLAMPWNSPTEIGASEEGRPFIEQFREGAFTRTLANPDVKLGALFQHGRDPSIGFKALGPIQAWQSSRGLEFEIQTLPGVDYAENILMGVRHGAYGGASIRFATRRDNVRRRPGRSPANPRGIEERTILEASLREISVVLWPAYSSTSVAA